jgi:beta-lactamase superfamily II metal-dependent hydrolase
VRTLLDRIALCDGEPCSLILSHWDADHFLGILSMTALEVSALHSVLVPVPIPRTATVQRALQALAGAGGPIVGLLPAPRPVGAGRAIVLVRQREFGTVTVFRATPGVSSNQTGIVVTAKGRSLTAILPGDHHYSKLVPLIRDASGIALVVPHHGGRAGAMNSGDWWSQDAFDAMLSFGDGNPYGHPLRETTQFLRRCGAATKATATAGDLSVRL